MANETVDAEPVAASSERIASESPPDPETENARDDAVRAAVTSTEVVERLAEVPKDERESAIAAAIMRLNDTVIATQNMVSSQQELTRQALDAIAKQQQNTDISAQRAAKASEEVVTAIEPVDQTKPDAGARPPDIKELPTKDLQDARSRSLWFGKAADRHGRGS